MATNATAQFWIRPADGAAANGGGYDSGISGAGTNYCDQSAPQAAWTTSLTLASGTLTDTASGGLFTAAMVGNLVNVSGQGSYWVTARADGNNVTVVAATNTSATSFSAASGKLGGGLASVRDVTVAFNSKSPVVAGNRVNVRGAGLDDPTTADLNQSYYDFSAGPAGNAASGPIRIVGYNGRPLVKTTVDCAFYTMNGFTLENLKIQLTSFSTGIAAVHSSGAGVSLVNCVIDQNGVDNAGTSATDLHDCEFRNSGSTAAGTAAALVVTTASGATGCTFRSWRGPIVTVAASASVNLDNCVLANGKSDGVVFAAAQSSRSRVRFCTIDGNAGAGVKVADASGLYYAAVTNCQVTNNGVGLQSAAADAASAGRAMRVLWDGNNLYGNTTARTNVPVGANDTATNPAYTASGSLNYGLGASFPALPTTYRGTATTTNLTVGAAQAAPGGGGGTYTSAANVRSGTDRGDGTLGTLVVPAASTVLIGTTYDATTAGTVTLPIVGDVEAGVTFGASLGLTGTFVVPTIGNVANTVGYGAGGTEFVGTLTGGSGPSAATIVTTLLTELLTNTDFNTVGSLGAALKGSLTSAGALLSTGTGAGQLSFASGVVAANMTQVNGSAVATSDGQARAGASSTITLAAGDAGVTNAYVDRIVTITSGAGLGQSRVVTAYDSTTKIATVHRAWDVPPDSSSFYAIDPTAAANAVEWGGAAVTGMPLPTASYVAQTGDAFARLGAAGAGLTALGDARLANLDATVSSRSTFAGGAVASVTGGVGGSVTGSVGSVVGSVGGNVAGSVGSVVGGVGGNVSGTVASVVGAVALPANPPTDWLNAASVKADAVAKIQSGLSTYAGADTAGTTALLARLTATRAGYLDNLSAGAAALASQIPANFTTAAFSSAGVFSVGALQNAPTGSGGSGGASILQIQTELDTRGLTASLSSTVTTNLNATVSSRSTYAGADTAGTTTLLGRVAGSVALAAQIPANFTAGTFASAGVFASAALANAPAPSAASVWDLSMSGHTTSGTFGAAMNAAGSAGDPWATALPGGYGAGTAGYAVGHNLDAPVSTRSTYAGADTSGTTALLSRVPTFPANFASLAITAGGLASVNLAQVGLTPRALDTVADSALTVGDGLVAAICAAAGKESVSGTSYTVRTPSTGTTVRTFVLDSSSAPTTRT